MSFLNLSSGDLERELEEFDVIYPSVMGDIRKGKKSIVAFGKGLILDLVKHYDHISEVLRPLCKRGNFES